MARHACALGSSAPRYLASLNHKHREVSMSIRRAVFAAMMLALAVAPAAGQAQTSPPASPGAAPAQPGTVLLTIFLKHDQSKTLDEINGQLAKNGYYKKFPPQGIEIDSWYVMMGIGQVVTLRLPA